MDYKTNPFYYSYVFTIKDVNRPPLHWIIRALIVFFPTYVQCADGYVFYFKRVCGRYYQVNCHKLNTVTINFK